MNLRNHKSVPTNQISRLLESLEDQLVVTTSFAHEPIFWTPVMTQDGGTVNIRGTVYAHDVMVNQVINDPADPFDDQAVVSIISGNWMLT